MHIVWLKSDYIDPPNTGGKIRTYNLLCRLSPWGNRDAMLQRVQTVLANSEVGHGAEAQGHALAIPDTVPAEVELLVRCALREAKG